MPSASFLSIRRPAASSLKLVRSFHGFSSQAMRSTVPRIAVRRNGVPLEALFADLAELCGFKRDQLAAVGESSLSTLKTQPDYAITFRNVLVGFVEVKAPGKGADPRRLQGA